MQLEANPPARHRWRDYLPGILVTAIAALAAAWLADHYAAPIVLMGLLIGLALSFLSQDKRTHAGLDLMSQTALRIGIVLVGARITAEQLVELGPLPFAMLVLIRSEEHTSELQSLMRISYAVFCLKKKI